MLIKGSHTRRDEGALLMDVLNLAVDQGPRKQAALQ